MWVDRMHGERCFVPLTKRLAVVASFVLPPFGVRPEMLKTMREL